MSVTVFTFIVMPLCLLWIMSPDKLLKLAAVVSCFEAAAALVIGGFGLQPGLVPSLIFSCFMILQLLLGARFAGMVPVYRLMRPYLLVVTYGLIASYIMPRLFEERVSVWPQKPPPPLMLTLLRPSSDNLNQDIYLINNSIFLFLAATYLTKARLDLKSFVHAYFISGCLVAAVSAWQFASRVAGVPFPTTVFYSNPDWSILTTQVIGPVPRINGPFAEPAAMAGYMASVVCASGWLLLRGHRARMLWPLFLISLGTMIISTATTGFAVLAIVTAGVPAAALLGRSTRLMASVLKVGLPLAALAVMTLFLAGIFIPRLNSNAATVVVATLNKQGTNSYNGRTKDDLDSLQAVVDTYGLGVGWGSDRSSSLIPGLLAGVGVPGVLGLLWFGSGIRRAVRAARQVGCSPDHAFVIDACCGGLVGFLLAGVISAPTITQTVFFILLALLIACTIRVQRDRRPAAGSGAATARQRRRAAPVWAGTGTVAAAIPPMIAHDAAAQH